MTHKALCSLTDAAKILGSEDQALALAARGELKMYVKIPDGSLLCSANRYDCQPQMSRPLGNPTYPPFLVAKEMTFLEIDAQQCLSLQENRYAQQSLFSFAIRLAPNGSISRERPPGPVQSALSTIAYQDSPLGLDRNFILCSSLPDDKAKVPSAMKTVEIEPNDVLMQTQRLTNLARKPKEGRIDFSKDIPLEVHAHTSKRLISLHAVLLELCAESAANGGAALPHAKAISSLLRARHEFSGNQADAGAQWIKRAKLRMDGDRMRLDAPEIAALIEWAGYWEKTSTDASEYPRNADTVKHLMKLGIPEYLAEVAPSIIKPDYAVKVGRPRSNP